MGLWYCFRKFWEHPARLGRASVEQGCRLGLASSLLSTLAILMPEKNKRKVGRCGASEHACVTLSKFRLIRQTMSLSGAQAGAVRGRALPAVQRGLVCSLAARTLGRQGLGAAPVEGGVLKGAA